MIKAQKLNYLTYRAGDFLIRIKNASMARRTEISLPSTKIMHALAECLKVEGYLNDVSLEKGILTIKLAQSHKRPVLMDIKLISKPGLRIYKSIDELKMKKTASSILVLSTSKGVMSNKKAIKENVGGEVIAEVW